MAGGKKSEAELNDLIEHIVVDAYGDDEQLWAFRQVMEDEIRLPADAFVVGEPVTVLEIDYDGNERRGLTVRCRREDGSEHCLAASDVVFPEGSKGADYVAAYRTWLGIEPYPPISVYKRPKATEDDLDMNKKVELVALAVREKSVSCRILGKNRVLTLRPAGLWWAVPGEILTVLPHRKWRYAGHPYLAPRLRRSRGRSSRRGDVTPEHAAQLAGLLRSREAAALGTLHAGAPFVSMVPWAVLTDGSGIVIHVSRLAGHTKDMLAAPQVSLLVMQPEGEGVAAQALARVSIQGVAQKMARESDGERECREAYLARFPEAAPLAGFGDFSFFLIRPAQARFVAGFAQAMSVTAETLAATLRAR